MADIAFFDFKNRFNESILYVAQPRFDAPAIGHHMLRSGTCEVLQEIVPPVLDGLVRIFQFNRENEKHLSIGLDAQLSNWCFLKSQHVTVPVYFDITTPLFRRAGLNSWIRIFFYKAARLFWYGWLNGSFSRKFWTDTMICGWF